MKTIALICTHNGEKYLKEQVTSLINQTIKLDLIVIDDYNSTDGTLNIIKDLAKEHENIIFNRYENAFGPAHSFMNSLMAIRDEQVDPYLLYLVDQDDVWLPLKNEKVITENGRLDFAICFHDVEIVDVNLSTIRESYYQSYWNVTRDLKFPNQLFSNCVIGHTCVLASWFIDNVSLEFDDRIPMHDWYLVNEAIFQNGKIVFIKEALSLYRQHDSNILGASRQKRVSIKKSIKNYSSTIHKFHAFLKERYPEEILSYKLDKPWTIIKNIRPLKKLLTILIVKHLYK